MKALVYDTTLGGWENTRGYWMQEIEKPVLLKSEKDFVIVKVAYAGFCGSDRGIWSRSSFGPFIESSLKEENKTKRIAGHEFFGNIVEAGKDVFEKFGFALGDTVVAESHVACGECYQCKNGQLHVCKGDKILGISTDGCFAEYAKIPAKILRHADEQDIDPRIAAIQEPFGNAVHACSKVPLKDKTVAIFGCGAIGSFAILIAKGLGAKKIIGVEPNEQNQVLARELGIDMIVVPGAMNVEEPWKHDAHTVEEIKRLTDGVGVDVALEMAGFNSSVNSAIFSTRRGGDVILFGLKSGNFVLENFECMIRNGINLHSIIGREIWRTWDITKELLENKENGIQEKIGTYILKNYEGVVSFYDFERDAFEEILKKYPKVVFDFGVKEVEEVKEMKFEQPTLFV
jgi:threonine 3-dehydrogenase